MKYAGRTRAGYILATWFGCGLVPYAPGTAGSLGAIPLYFALRAFGPVALVLASLAVALVGVWAASIVATHSGLKDPQIVVIDEVCGVLLTLAAAPHSYKGVFAGFVLFRIFDQFKPWPARAAEALPSGWGIVLDDVAAGGWGIVALLSLRQAGIV